MDFLNILKEKLAGSKEFNQNADREVLGGTSSIPYQSGISEQDVYKLALAEKARKANEYNNIMRMIDANRVGVNAANASRTQPEIPSASDAAFYAQDGIDVYKGYNKDMEEYARNKALADAYSNTVDQGLAAKWMESYKGR